MAFLTSPMMACGPLYRPHPLNISTSVRIQKPQRRTPLNVHIDAAVTDRQSFPNPTQSYSSQSRSNDSFEIVRINVFQYRLQAAAHLLVDFFDYARGWRLEQPPLALSSNVTLRAYNGQSHSYPAHHSPKASSSSSLDSSNSNAVQGAYRPALVVQHVRKSLQSSLQSMSRVQGRGILEGMQSMPGRGIAALAGALGMLCMLLVDVLDYARAYRS